MRLLFTVLPGTTIEKPLPLIVKMVDSFCFRTVINEDLYYFFTSEMVCTYPERLEVTINPELKVIRRVSESCIIL